jgi:nucleoside 2-deoxyribosyltransferase
VAREAGAAMRIYLAGPSAELARVREAAALIEAAGHTLTEQWWEKVADTGTCASDVDHPEPILAVAAVQNCDGIDTADVVIALCREAGGLSPGVAHEVGYAQGTCADVILVGNPRGHLAARWRTRSITTVATVAEALAIAGAL